MKYLIGIVVVLIGVFLVQRKRTVEKTKIYKWNAKNELLRTDFINLLSQKPNLEYLVVEFKSYYIQYKGFGKTKEFYSEIVSDNFLEDENQYSESQNNKILEFNFLEPKKKDSDGNVSLNYSKWYGGKSKKDIELIFNELIEVLESVYNITEGSEIKIRY